MSNNHSAWFPCLQRRAWSGCVLTWRSWTLRWRRTSRQRYTSTTASLYAPPQVRKEGRRARLVRGEPLDGRALLLK
jgi:hypothetical protein